MRYTVVIKLTRMRMTMVVCLLLFLLSLASNTEAVDARPAGDVAHTTPFLESEEGPTSDQQLAPHEHSHRDLRQGIFCRCVADYEDFYGATGTDRRELSKYYHYEKEAPEPKTGSGTTYYNPNYRQYSVKEGEAIVGSDGWYMVEGITVLPLDNEACIVSQTNAALRAFLEVFYGPNGDRSAETFWSRFQGGGNDRRKLLHNGASSPDEEEQDEPKLLRSARHLNWDERRKRAQAKRRNRHPSSVFDQDLSVGTPYEQREIPRVFPCPPAPPAPESPSAAPSDTPSSVPSDVPSLSPTISFMPSDVPSDTPSMVPTRSQQPSLSPLIEIQPDTTPQPSSSELPTASMGPSNGNPTMTPAPSVSQSQSESPVVSDAPAASAVPSISMLPTVSMAPSSAPSITPLPTVSAPPSISSTVEGSGSETPEPSADVSAQQQSPIPSSPVPSAAPSEQPSSNPSPFPSSSPSAAPTNTIRRLESIENTVPDTKGALLLDTVSAPAPLFNDQCRFASEIFVGNHPVVQLGGNKDTAATTRQPNYGCEAFAGVDNEANGVWFTALGNGNEYTLTTCSPDTDFDTSIQVFVAGKTGYADADAADAGDDDDDACDNLQCVPGAGSDLDPGCGLSSPMRASAVTFVTEPGERYYFLVFGRRSTDSGSFGLTLHQRERVVVEPTV